MTKTSIKTLILKQNNEDTEVILWEDDRTGKFSVSIDNSFHGFTKNSNIKKLIIFLQASLKIMEEQGGD